MGKKVDPSWLKVAERNAEYIIDDVNKQQAAGLSFIDVNAGARIDISTADIYVDPLIQPISTDSNKGTMVLDAVRAIKAEFPQVHITGGLSNISYGLPQRHIINRTFVSLMMDAGMDSAIMDPLDKKIMATIKTADMLLGNDPFCMAYLKGVRSGSIES